VGFKKGLSVQMIDQVIAGGINMEKLMLGAAIRHSTGKPRKGFSTPSQSSTASRNADIFVSACAMLILHMNVSGVGYLALTMNAPAESSREHLEI
jgi:hypothetical protein